MAEGETPVEAGPRRVAAGHAYGDVGAEVDADGAIIDHFARIGFSDLPEHTVEKTKLLVLDTVGAALAAIGAEGCAELRRLAARWGGRPEAHVLGTVDHVPAHTAALVNATMARALELDDVHEAALVHATATMVPVALAVAQQVGGVSGRTFLAAVAAGIDLGCRLSKAPVVSLGGEGYKPRAMSYTYQTGTLAGSLVAAKVARLDPERLADAFGVGYSQCAGNLQGLVEGSLTVRVQQGISAQSAVLAMELAREGITGTRHSLEGIYGWFQAFYGGEYDRRALLDDLGTRFEVDEVSVKPYACCKYGHTAIAAAVEIAHDPGFDLQRLEEVTVTVASQDCWDLICAPPDVKASPGELAGPRGWTLAQFSLPYMVACGLVRQGLRTADLERDVRTDPAVLDALSRVRLVLDDRTVSVAELPEPGVVEARLDDGTVIGRRVTRAIGHPERPMSVDEQREKFRWYAERLPPATVERLMDAVLDLERVDDVSALVRLASGEASEPAR